MNFFFISWFSCIKDEKKNSLFLHISLGGQQWWGVWNSILKKKCFKNTGQAGISNDKTNKDEIREEMEEEVAFLNQICHNLDYRWIALFV